MARARWGTILVLALAAIVPSASAAASHTGGASGYVSAQIDGVVKDQDGAPLYGMTVEVSDYQRATTNAKGQYSIAGLQPGSYTVDVIDGDQTVRGGSVDLTSGTAVVDVTLPAPAVPAGTTAHNAVRDLAYLNAERAADGLPAGVLQNTRWSVECAAHDLYLRDNHLLQHPENPTQRGASPGGAWAGESAVLSEGVRWKQGRNPWEDAPIHLDQLFSPSLSVVGIDDSGGYLATTTWPGMLRSPVSRDTIYTYPGNGSRDVPTSELAREAPFVPGQFVGIPASRTTGREMFVYLSSADQVGPSPVTIASATMKRASGKVEIRWVNTTTKEIGPFLAGAIVIPVRPLTAGTKYTVTVKVKDGKGRLSHSWSFTTGGKPPSRHHHG